MTYPAADSAPAPKKYSAALRIWHWASAAAIAGLLTTILFLRVIIRMKDQLPKIQAQLGEQGVQLTEDQARIIGRAVSHQIWDWHIYLGVTLSCLLALRVLTELFQPRGQRFSARLRQASEQQAAAPEAGFRLRHSVLVKYSYLAFYLMLLVMVSTGLCLIYADDVPWLHELEHNLEEVHNATMYAVIGFIVVHLVGVVWAELHKDKGITSDMINGGK